LEIFQCPTGEPEKQKDLLRAVLEACQAAEEYQSSSSRTDFQSVLQQDCHSERSQEAAGRQETLRSAQGDSHAQGDNDAHADSTAQRDALWAQLESFSRAVHAGLNPRETAYTIANEGRRLIGCDRLSVAILRGATARVE